MSGAHSSLVLSDLAPETTYEVALIPESNVHYFPPQTTRVTTLAGKMGMAWTHSFLGDKEMIPVSYLRQEVQMEDAGTA